MRILTAIGDNELAKELKDKGFEICSYDIQYKEGILEFLEINDNVDFIIINNELPGDISINDLIAKISKINSKIKILIVNSNQYFNNNIKTFEKLNFEDVIYYLIYESKEGNIKKNEEEGKIITILGTNGIGKSVFSINLANVFDIDRKLIIDFDVLNNSLHNLLGVKNYTNKIQTNLRKNILNFSYKKSFVWEDDEKYELDTKPLAIKTNYNVDLISGVNLIFDTKTQISPSRVRNIILKLKSIYKLIIIDTSTQCFLEYSKEVMEISDELIFLSGASLYEIQKSQKLLSIYTEEYKISRDKFYIVFNKCTDKSIDDRILKQLFNEYRILGKIKLREYYDYIINNNKKYNKKINNEMREIGKRGDIYRKYIRSNTKQNE